MAETLKFSLDLAEVPVELDSKSGESRAYVLREMTGKQRDLYLQSLRKKATVGKDGQVTLNNFDGLQSNLLTRCLFNSDGENVSEDEIQEFPSKVQTILFEKCQELNGLNQEEEGEEGN